MHISYSNVFLVGCRKYIIPILLNVLIHNWAATQPDLLFWLYELVDLINNLFKTPSNADCQLPRVYALFL